MAKSPLFTPLGVDYIVMACYSRHYWHEVLKHIGFQECFATEYGNDADKKQNAERLCGLPLRFGNVKFLLVDPSTALYNSKQIHEFLVKNGDFQVYAVGILVDSVVRAQEEIGGSFGAAPDPFGEGSRLVFPAPMKTSFWWHLVEREEIIPHLAEKTEPSAVDHIAIAVENMKETAAIYRALGFRTVYRPHSEIRGQYSGMKTVALQRGGWTVALVEGVDGKERSQVTRYRLAHGNHSVQHIALRFNDLYLALEALRACEVRFRTHALSFGQAPLEFQDVIHYGKDHEGVLLQAFAKPFLRFIRWDPQGVFTADGLFFECMERFQGSAHGRIGFYSQTVKGLYRSIEDEELLSEEGEDTMLPPSVMSRFEYDTRFSALTKRGAWRNL